MKKLAILVLCGLPAAAAANGNCVARQRSFGTYYQMPYADQGAGCYGCQGGAGCYGAAPLQAPVAPPPEPVVTAPPACACQPQQSFAAPSYSYAPQQSFAPSYSYAPGPTFAPSFAPAYSYGVARAPVFFSPAVRVRAPVFFSTYAAASFAVSPAFVPLASTNVFVGRQRAFFGHHHFRHRHSAVVVQTPGANVFVGRRR